MANEPVAWMITNAVINWAGTLRLHRKDAERTCSDEQKRRGKYPEATANEDDSEVIPLLSAPPVKPGQPPTPCAVVTVERLEKLEAALDAAKQLVWQLHKQIDGGGGIVIDADDMGRMQALDDAVEALEPKGGK